MAPTLQGCRTHLLSAFQVVRCFFLAIAILGAEALAQDAQTCGVCHQTIHAQWLKSRHREAWTSTRFQAQMLQAGSAEFCGTCHIPQSIWLPADLKPSSPDQPPPSLQLQLREKLAARQTERNDGVYCNTCHSIEIARAKAKSNELVGPYAAVSASHPGIQAVEFSTFKVCGTCHGRAPEEYMPHPSQADASYYHSRSWNYELKFGESDCARCHMPHRQQTLVQLKVFKDLPVRALGEHTFSGRAYSSLGDALGMEIKWKEGVAHFVLTNTALGHALKVCPETEYRLVVVRLEKGKVIEINPLQNFQPELLKPGESVEFPLAYGGPPGLSFQVELFVKKAALPEERILQKVVQ